MSQSSCASFVFFFFFLGYLKGSINFFPQVPLETVAENVTGNLGSSKIVNTSKRHYLQRVASREKESIYIPRFQPLSHEVRSRCASIFLFLHGGRIMLESGF